MNFVTGDQSVVWDAPLKLRLLSDLGHSVTHQIHSADLFSRPRNGVFSPEVTRESYGMDGNVNRWTASLEGCTFLGRMPVSCQALTAAGIDFDAVTRGRSVKKPTDLSTVVEDLTSGDWLGLSHPDSSRVAHGFKLSHLESTFQKLRRPFRRDHTGSFGDSGAVCFDLLWEFSRDGNLDWTVAAAENLENVLSLFGVNSVNIVSTVGEFADRQSQVLSFFVDNYDVARECYNEAVSEGVDRLAPLSEGELPFYAVVDNGQYLVREELTCMSGDDVDSIIREVSKKGRVVAILGKALPLMVDLCAQGSLVLLERGSLYRSQCRRFTDLLGDCLSSRIDLYPIHRLRLNALDALKDVAATIKLPEYLHGPFGAESMAGSDFARCWRDVVESSMSLAKDLSVIPIDLSELRSFLVNNKFLTPALADQVIGIRKDMAGIDERIKAIQSEAFQICPKKGKPDTNIKERTRWISGQKQRLFDELDPAGMRYVLQALMNLVANRHAEKVRSLIAVSSLEYWNCRPFSTWVFGVSGWYESILDSCELVQEKNVDDSASSSLELAVAAEGSGG